MVFDMRMRQSQLAVCLLLTLGFADIAHTADKDPSMSVDRAIQLVGRPAQGFGNMSPFELQVHYRLTWLFRMAKYKYDGSHAAAWKNCMLDADANMYARLCATYFLLDHDAEARAFVQSQLISQNLRYRYNAAEIVEMYVARDSRKEWGVNTLIKLLADGSLDGSGVTKSPPGEYPSGDRNDIMGTPMDGICWSLGFMKAKSAVPALISVLERKPGTGGAAFALGEIGDKRATPILLKILEDRSGYENREITALGQMKCVEAVPILVARLGHPRTTGGDSDTREARTILEALLEIGDKRAIAPIEDYLRADSPKQSKAVAKRVLAELRSPDPVETLLTLLRTETYEPERSDIIAALTKYKDARVVKELEGIARTSDSAFMRREAITGLRDIGDRQSLLILASLLDVAFPEDLKADWGWKGVPDLRRYFPDTIAMCLKQCTKQDFGKDRAKWEEWITKNVEPTVRDDNQRVPQPRR